MEPRRRAARPVNTPQHLEPGSSSPWGLIQETYPLIHGIWRVSTATHGGLYVEPDLAVCVLGRPCRPMEEWFEEDDLAEDVFQVFPEARDRLR